MIPESRIFNSAITLCVLLVCFIMPARQELRAGQNSDLKQYNELYEAGKYKEASDFGVKKIGEDKADKSKLLESLQTAVALRYDHQYDLSSKVFDQCEMFIKDHDEKSGAANVTRDVGMALVNDGVVDYVGTQYDGIMVNTYNGLNYWQMGDLQKARVSFNRAVDRQRRATERFASEIAEANKELDKKKSEEQNSTLKSKEVANIYTVIDQYKVYPNFKNPFASYMAGLFFMSEGDYAKASASLKEAFGMTRNKVVKDDLLMVEGRHGGKKGGAKGQQQYVWVVFENGACAIKEEWRVDLPLFLITKEIKYTGIALPKLKSRDFASSALTVKDGGVTLGRTTELSSMDNVIQTEFKKRYPVIVRRAVVSAALKTVVQGEVQKRTGSIGGFFAGLAQRATTSADLRMWTGLPREFQICRVSLPKNGTLNLATAEGKEVTVNVPMDHSSLVYVKMTTPNAEPYYDVIAMKN